MAEVDVPTLTPPTNDTAYRVAVAAAAVATTVGRQRGAAEHEINAFVAGAELALWYVMFAGVKPGDFPDIDAGRDAGEEVAAELRRRQIKVHFKVMTNVGGHHGTARR